MKLIELCLWIRNTRTLRIFADKNIKIHIIYHDVRKKTRKNPKCIDIFLEKFSLGDQQMFSVKYRRLIIVRDSPKSPSVDLSRHSVLKKRPIGGQRHDVCVSSTYQSCSQSAFYKTNIFTLTGSHSWVVYVTQLKFGITRNKKTMPWQLQLDRTIDLCQRALKN